jgi:hypothetical protein
MKHDYVRLYNETLDKLAGDIHANLKAAEAVLAQHKADEEAEGKPACRAVWYAEDGSSILKGYLVDYSLAKAERDFLRSHGRTAWLEDAECNKVEEA